MNWFECGERLQRVVLCQLQGQILTTAIWKPSLEYEHRMPTLCPKEPLNIFGKRPVRIRMQGVVGAGG
jgi:hypothetical protein